MIDGLGADERAVRNLISYSITFSVIIFSVGLVATAGYGQLNAVSESQQITNAERSMVAVTSGFQALDQERAVVRRSELDLSDGSLSVGNDSTVRVNVTDTNVNETLTPRSLELDIGDTTFTYTNGALLRDGVGERPAMIESPPVTCVDGQAVVPVVSLTVTDTAAIGGEEVSVTGRTVERELLFPLNRTGPDSNDATDTVNVTVSSDRSAAWNRYFERNGNWTAAPDEPDTYSCSNVGAVFVRRTVVEVSFQT